MLITIIIDVRKYALKSLNKNLLYVYQWTVFLKYKSDEIF